MESKVIREFTNNFFSKISGFGVVVTIIIQTFFLVAWLATMRSDISTNKELAKANEIRLNEIDAGGSKIAALLQQRIATYDIHQESQNKRMERIEEKDSQLLKSLSELFAIISKHQAEYEGIKNRLDNLEKSAQRHLESDERNFKQLEMQKLIIDTLKQLEEKQKSKK